MTNQEQFTPEQISHMLSLQDELNTIVHPQWKEQGFEWNIAALAELVEIKEWLGWKWWTEGYKQGLVESNKKQIQIEVIDILHFWLSWELTTDNPQTPDDIVYYLGLYTRHKEQPDIDRIVADLLYVCIADKYLSWVYFGYLVGAVGLTPEQVYETYLGKYTLNIFRQKHGYKTGEYKKHWLIPVMSLQFQEDNWFLEKAIEQIKEQGHSVSIERIENCLEYWYGIVEGGK